MGRLRGRRRPASVLSTSNRSRLPNRPALFPWRSDTRAVLVACPFPLHLFQQVLQLSYAGRSHDSAEHRSGLPGSRGDHADASRGDRRDGLRTRPPREPVLPARRGPPRPAGGGGIPEQLAEVFGARPRRSSSPAAGPRRDNLAVKGLYWARHDGARRRVLTTSVEHHAILDGCGWRRPRAPSRPGWWSATTAWFSPGAARRDRAGPRAGRHDQRDVGEQRGGHDPAGE